MKAKVFLFFIFITFLSNANFEKPTILEPQWAGANCGEVAIQAYDNLINQEVDTETALEYAVSLYNDCSNGQQ